MKNTEHPTPLQEYLSQAGLTQEEFAAKLTESRGYPAGQSFINSWCTGKRLPNRGSQRDIEKATRGRVTPAMWELWSSSRGQDAAPLEIETSETSEKVA